ncbi:MAG: ZinT family metal-binding protein [Sulfitobacter sp.]
MTLRLGLSSLSFLVAATLAVGPVAAAGKDHDHSHTLSAEQQAIYDGHFDDAQIEQRPFSDWQGDWQSVFPLLEAGKLAPVMAHKAESGTKTAQEYADYYAAGYATDVDRITIEGPLVTFYGAAGAVQGRYISDGYEILTYKKGNRGVRFIFEKAAGDAQAPQFIQFSDHKIAPAVSDHYHLYWGNDRAALLNEVSNWPTYYPAALSADEIVSEMLAH